jgi:hypothetical protein
LDEEHKKRIKLLERANEKSNDESDGLDWENEEDAQSSNVISSKTYEEEEKPSEQSNIELQQDKPKTVDEIQEFNDDSSQNQLGNITIMFYSIYVYNYSWKSDIYLLS